MPPASGYRFSSQSLSQQTSRPWPSILLMLAIAGVGWLGLQHFHSILADGGTPRTQTFGLVSLGLLGIWRWSWFILHLVRAQIYLVGLFPHWRRQAQRVAQRNWPALAVVVPSYREEPAVTERVFVALAEAARQLPIPVTIVAITTPPEMVAITAILQQQDAPGKHLKLITLPQTGAGKRKALADGLRALQAQVQNRQIPRPEVVVLMDGDSIVGTDTLRQCLPLFRVLPQVGAMTTDETPQVDGGRFFADWMELRFAQRHIQMASQSLSRKLLCLTGRFSLFRADIALHDKFIAQVENDAIQDWLWGDFRFLSGDDKSTWFWVLKQGYQMIYVPDTKVISVETISGNQWLRIYQNMRRWFGNMLRNSNRSLSLGPWRTGWFIWWCLLDQRLNCWTSLTTPGIMVVCLCLGNSVGLGLLWSWILFSRPLTLLLLVWERPFALKPIHLVQLLLAQWSSALVKIYTQMHLAQQRWTNRGNQQVGAGGAVWQRRLKAGIARWLLVVQVISFGLFLLWSLRLVDPITALGELQQLASPPLTAAEQVVVARAWGVQANDGRNDTPALQRLLEHLPKRGAVQVILPAGELHLRQSLYLQRNYTILVGAGTGRTIIYLHRGAKIVIAPLSPQKHLHRVALRGMTMVQTSGTALVVQQLQKGQLENLQFLGQGETALSHHNSPGLQTYYLALEGKYTAAPMQSWPKISRQP